MFSWVKMPAECLDKSTKVIVFFKSIAFVRYAVLTCKMILLVDEHCAVCCFCFVVLCNTSQRCSIEKKYTTYSYVESHIIGQLLEEIFTMLAL